MRLSAPATSPTIRSSGEGATNVNASNYSNLLNISTTFGRCERLILLYRLIVFSALSIYYFVFIKRRQPINKTKQNNFTSSLNKINIKMICCSHTQITPSLLPTPTSMCFNKNTGHFMLIVFCFVHDTTMMTKNYDFKMFGRCGVIGNGMKS